MVLYPEEPRAHDFRGLLLVLRGRAGLSQRELAALTGASERTVRTWETGQSYPGSDHLKALIALYFQRGVLATGREREEASALWGAARREAPRLNAPFDQAWFAQLLANAGATVQPTEPPPGAPLDILPVASRGQDWGEAPDVSVFHGRAQEIETLGHWVLDDGCRLVVLLGMGGIGKTTLASQLAHELAPRFDAVYWRSLRNGLPCADWLAGAILFLSGQQTLPAEGEEARLRQLLELLRERRSLLVLDNLESVLESGEAEVGYREGYAGYGLVLQWLGEARHPSCLLLTSRELPAELGPQEGEQRLVRTLRLGGVDGETGRALLAGQGLVGDAAAWEALVARYGGNALALLVVGETIHSLFGGLISAFLAQGEAVFGNIRRLLDGQLGRLSGTERRILDWLAIEREPVDFGALVADLGPALPRGAALEALEALRRRSLLEQGQQRATFTLQPVVLEHVTVQLVDGGVAGIVSGAPHLLERYALVKARAKEHVRRSQERLIATPLLERLAVLDGSEVATDRLLLALLDRWRGRPANEQGHGPGNAVNLLRLLRGHLRGLDLSDLELRQAYLTVPAQDTSLAGARLADPVLTEAAGAIASTALSPDGRFAVVGTYDGEVQMWELAERRRILAVEHQPGPAWGVAVSADGRWVGSGAGDGIARLWDVASGECVHVLQGHTAGVLAVAMSADGQRVATGAGDGTVRLWDATSGECLHVLQGHTGGVRGVALTTDGQLVASGGLDATVRLWDAGSGECVRVLQGHAAGIWGVALNADGQRVVSGGLEATVRVWDTTSGECVHVLQGHTAGVLGVGMSADGRRMVTGAGDGTVRLWDAASGECLHVLQGHAGGARGVAASADGQLVASGGLDATVRLWDAASGECLHVLQGYTTGIWGVAVSADGQRIASGGIDATVRLWDAGSGECVRILQGHTSAVWSVALSADGQHIASGGLDTTLRLWDAASGRCVHVLTGHTAAVWSVAMSVGGRHVVTGAGDGTVRLWDAASGECLHVLQGHIGGVRGVALSTDGQLVASGGLDATVRLWDAESGECVRVLQGHTGGIWGVALSADGRRVASGGLEATVRLWDTATGECVHILQGHTGGVRGVAVSIDGQLVASGGLDATVRLWDAKSGECLHVLQGHTAGVWGVGLSADSQCIASGGADATLRLWDVQRGTLLRPLRQDRPYERLDITGLSGITDTQRAALFALGAVEQADGSLPEPTSGPGRLGS